MSFELWNISQTCYVLFVVVYLCLFTPYPLTPQHIKKSKQTEEDMLYGTSVRSPCKRRFLGPTTTPGKARKVTSAVGDGYIAFILGIFIQRLLSMHILNHFFLLCMDGFGIFYLLGVTSFVSLCLRAQDLTRWLWVMALLIRDVFGCVFVCLFVWGCVCSAKCNIRSVYWRIKQHTFRLRGHGLPLTCGSATYVCQQGQRTV